MPQRKRQARRRALARRRARCRPLCGRRYPRSDPAANLLLPPEATRVLTRRRKEILFAVAILLERTIRYFAHESVDAAQRHLRKRRIRKQVGWGAKETACDGGA